MFHKIKMIATGYIHIILLFVTMLISVSFVFENYNDHEVVVTLIWVCATFVLQISTSKLFISDYYNGILEQTFIQPFSSVLMVIYKILAHWLVFGSSISIIASIFSFIVLSIDIKYAIMIGLSLLFNTLVMVSISTTGNALTLGKNDLASVISQILVLPVIMPVFIYFKLLMQHRINIHIILITALVFIILMANSIMATYTALKFAVEQD